jgi:hypothetical protein
MNNWRNEIKSALLAFVNVAELAGEPVQLSDLIVEYLEAPHRPSSLPSGKMAIYAFWWNDTWLKIGKAGPNSGPRYISQHYTGQAISTLAGSLVQDLQIHEALADFDAQMPGKWIKTSTCRVNILLPSNRRKALLSLLEVFLHVRLNPMYEG